MAATQERADAAVAGRINKTTQQRQFIADTATSVNRSIDEVLARYAETLTSEIDQEAWERLPMTPEEKRDFLMEMSTDPEVKKLWENIKSLQDLQARLNAQRHLLPPESSSPRTGKSERPKLLSPASDPSNPVTLVPSAPRDIPQIRKEPF